jgi:hypothetical protein
MHGYDWTGYWLDLFGAFVVGPDVLQGAPYCQIALPDDDSGAEGFLHWSHRGGEAPRPLGEQRVRWIRLWEQRAYLNDTPLYAESLWQPTEEQSLGIHYARAFTPTTTHRAAAWAALQHLEDTATRAERLPPRVLEARAKLLDLAIRWGGEPEDLERGDIKDMLVKSRTTTDRLFREARFGDKPWGIYDLRKRYRHHLDQQSARDEANEARG